MFFPKNENAVQVEEFTKQLLDELEKLLPEGKDDDIPGNKKIKVAYSRLWAINGDEQYKGLQSRFFHIITNALESLTPQQLLEAVSFDPDSNKLVELDLDQLEGLYCNFLKTNSEGYLDYEHLSAEIFVSEKKKEGFGTSAFQPQPFLARSCLYCLSTTGFQSEFYSYAARNWVSHYNKAGDKRAEISETAADVFRTGPNTFHTWFPIYWAAAERPTTTHPNLTALMAASYLGLEMVVEILIEEEPNINEKTEDGWTALHWAFKNDRTVSVMEKLLNGGVDCAAQDDNGQTALHLAVNLGRKDVLPLLAAHQQGVCLEVKDVLGLTALHLAVRMAEWRHDKGEELVEVLLDHGASRNALNLLGRTPEEEATLHRRESEVRLLHDGDASPTTSLDQQRLKETSWNFLRAGISQSMWDPDSIDIRMNMALYT